MTDAAPIRLDSFPRAIVHFDGDAFFTSVEQAQDPALRGRPVVTGKERGIIACASYEAKALGIRRGIALHEARRMCPALVVLPSDYETYSLYSKRMFALARTFTPEVEEYSIDEGFADLTGLRRFHRASYEAIARRFQQAVRDELGITVSIGLSCSKGLAKMASDFRKPAGVTAVRGRHIHLFLARRSLADVWGFGPNTVARLNKEGLRTALDFALKTEDWAGRRLGKVGREIWNELRGAAVWPLHLEPHRIYASISKGKTFTAPSTDRAFIYAKLIRNVESAFIKLRRHGLRARTISIGLRRQDYQEAALGVRLSRPTDATLEAIPAVRLLFEKLHVPGAVYRTTTVLLEDIECARERQPDLFEDQVQVEKMIRVSRALDDLAAAFGKHTVALGTALDLDRHPVTDRDEAPRRKADLLPGETARQRLRIPRLAIKI